MKTGQEAVAIGMHSVMRKIDTVITSYRCHVWAYIMGLSAIGLLAELTGRKSGCCRSKGGSMHLYAPNFFGGNGIVGAQVYIFPFIHHSFICGTTDYIKIDSYKICTFSWCTNNIISSLATDSTFAKLFEIVAQTTFWQRSGTLSFDWPAVFILRHSY